MCSWLSLLLGACNGGEEPTPTSIPTATTRVEPPPPTHTPTPIPTPTLTPTPLPQTPTVTPLRGGTLNYAISGSTTSFDPFLQSDLSTHAFIQPAYNGLVKFDIAGEAVVPDLAESWKLEDSLTLVFNLRQGVSFHDGAPFTAKQAAFSIHRALNPLPGTTSLVRPFLVPISSVEAVGDYTLRLSTDRPWASALTRLAHPFLRMIPEHVANRSPLPTPPPPKPTPIPTGMRDVVLGTGPFQFVSYDPEAGGRLTRNPDYWERGKPYLDALRLHILPDKKTALAGTRTGFIDLYLGPVDPEDLSGLRKSLPMLIGWRFQDLVAGPEVVLNLTKAPFDDLRVRKALRLAVDSEAMYKAHHNKGPLAFNSPMGLTQWGLLQRELALRPESGPPLSLRIETAKGLLAQAGVEEGFSVTVIVGHSEPDSERTGGQGLKARILAENLRALELEVQVVEKPVPGEFQTDLLLLRYDVAVVETEFDGHPDPDGLKLFWKSRGSRNYSAYSDPGLDALLERQSIVLSEQERRELVREAQERILDSYAAFYLPLALPSEESPAMGIMHPWVRGFRYDWSGAEFNNLRFDEVWLDAAVKKR